MSYRSTKAGPAGPATLRVRRRVLAGPGGSLNEGRSGRTGNPSVMVASLARLPTVAQRRPVRPDRQPPRVLQIEHFLRLRRSTKAGPAGPATQGRRLDRVAATGRSTKAGPAGPATPADGGQRVGAAVDRSTKAGPAGPATPDGDGEAVVGGERSTKAGPAGPATPPSGRTVIAVPRSAQRRPVRPDRQPGSIQQPP